MIHIMAAIGLVQLERYQTSSKGVANSYHYMTTILSLQGSTFSSIMARTTRRPTLVPD